MGKVVVDLTMSLDGFIAGPEDDDAHPLGRDGEQIFNWYFNGDEPSQYNDFFKPAGSNRKIVDEMFEQIGAFVSGRRTYDITNGWNGTHPVNGLPVFILTHHPPQQVPRGKSKITFVTDGIQSAIEQAKRAAGDKNVSIGGATAAQQAISAGLVDEIHIHLVPVLLGTGVRLFDRLGDKFIKLENIRLVDSPGVTHFKFRVVK